MGIFARARRIAALMAALLLGVGTTGGWAQSAPKTLRFIPQADLWSIDPIWTTAYGTRNFGFLVFDTPAAQFLTAARSQPKATSPAVRPRRWRT
jgi:hypothetical protein